ncbi:hypothetical protein [Vibrio mexicanus]|uniref:hypothetical protein n=1 Tax=Vibrio mexicanus TaxID=1004326 RepID=UPI00063CB7ED|nr:hypothetical protein [Vibrio mexicanus]
MSEIPSIVEVKNQWLYSHIDIKFPTKESIQGRRCYKARAKDAEYQVMDVPEIAGSFIDSDLYKVDFHRATVMFSLLQAKRWEEQSEQEAIVEFFTQIIFSPPCDLYLGFADGQAIAAAIVTSVDGELLISDLACDSEKVESEFISSLFARLKDGHDIVYLEKPLS